MNIDILKSVVDFIQTVWAFVGFCAFTQAGYNTVVFRGTTAVRYSDSVIVFKIPVFEQYKFVPSNIITNRVLIFKKCAVPVLTRDLYYMYLTRITNPVEFVNSFQFLYKTAKLDLSVYLTQIGDIITGYLYKKDVAGLSKYLNSKGVELCSVEKCSESIRVSFGAQ